jgi:hypothetical protein
MNTLTATNNSNSVDPFEKIAQDEGSGELLKFSKGEWLAGETVLNGVKMTAEMGSLAIGSRKWVDGKIVAADLGLVASGFEPKTRDQLDDLDQSKWPLNSRGERTDPWQFGYYLCLTDSDGRTYIWPATSSGARRAVGVLSRAYAKKRGLGVLPVVELKADVYRHKDFGKVDVPVLAIVGWTKGDAPIATGTVAPPTSPVAAPASVVTSSPPEAEAPFEDIIPF